MIKIYIFTSTRAEYGLMKPLIKRMSDDEDFDVKLLVSGTHLSHQYGYTINEIIEDNYADIIKIDILSEKNDSNGVSETMANTITKFSYFFSNNKPDYLFIDGDRYESLAVAIAAVNNNIPIIHNGGGCTTEGAADEYYRHAITKMSILHFTSTKEYRRRIVQMGENPLRVFAVGSLGIENIINAPLIDKDELSKQINFDLNGKYAVLTFHPVTLEDCSYEYQVKQLLKALDKRTDLKYIVTGANSDNGGKRINYLMREYCNKHVNTVFIDSLGMIRYLSSLKYCHFVIGNSSSGLIEVPSFGIPTINIGDRQKGRLKAESIIDCKPDVESILNAMNKAEDSVFREKCKRIINPNGDGNTSSRIVEAIKSFDFSHGRNIQKHFFNIQFEI